MATDERFDRAARLLEVAKSTPGFLPIDEAMALHALAGRAAESALGPLVEIGGYLGRSTLFLAAGLAAKQSAAVLFSVDHHHGSEELQEGWPDHDPVLVDRRTGRMDTLVLFRKTIEDAAAEDLVVAVVGDSASIAANWHGPLALVFVDGGHGASVCWADYRGWTPHVALGGFLAFHDVYPDPADGGRAPFDCFIDALSSAEFEEDVDASSGSLRVLVRSAKRGEQRRRWPS